MSNASAETATPDVEVIAILLVDDEPAILQTLQRLLRCEQYQLLSAESGAEALARMEQAPIDVVVCDIRMPDMGGVQLLAQIATRWPDTSRIALTGSTELTEVIEAINMGGVFRWVQKPWDAEALRRTVREAADRAKKIQATRRRLQISEKKNKAPDELPHVIKKSFQGEVIHKEDSPGTLAHFIRTGKVELSVIRDGKRIILDTRRAGDCFGVLAPVLGGTHSVTATAVEYTETFAVTRPVLDALLRKNDALLTTLVKSMAEQTRRSLMNLAMRDPVVNPVECAAAALDLMAQAALQKGPGTSPKGQIPTVKLPLQDVVQTLSAVTGMVKINASALLDQMACLNLIAIDNSRLVYIKPGEIVSAAKKIGASHGDTLFDGLRAEAELMSIDEMAAVVGVEKSMIQQKLTRGELPEDLWVFKRSETLRLVHEKGREFFRKRKNKKVEEYDEIQDLMLVDRETIGRVLSQMDIYRVAAALKRQDEELRERALGSISKRIRAFIQDAMDGLDQVDDAEASAAEMEIIERIKTMKGVGSTDKGRSGS